MHLLDLPAELTALIFEALGGANLRKDVSLLAVSKTWYHFAYPVFHSGLDLGQLRLSHHSLEQFPPDGSRRRELIKANTKSIHISLKGHSWDTAGYTWEHVGGEHHDHDREVYNTPPTWYKSDDEQSRGKLLSWKDMVNRRLRDVASTLSSVEHLEEFELTAVCDVNALDFPFGHPRAWNYLSSQTVAKLITGLIGKNIENLTIDTCGATLDYAIESRVHVCPLVAKCLSSVRHLRIRMFHICTDIFNDNAACNGTHRLETMIIKRDNPPLDLNLEDHANYASLLFQEQVQEQGSLSLFTKGVLELGQSTQWENFETLRLSFRVHRSNTYTDPGLFTVLSHTNGNISQHVMNYNRGMKRWWELNEDMNYST